MKIFKGLFVLIALAVLFSSCTTMTHSMKIPDNRIEFKKDDFEFSKQVSGEANEIKIFGIDFARLFSKKYGELEARGMFSIPIIGGIVGTKANLYALYNMMKDNPGYDVVIYPQYEVKKTGFPIIFVTTKAKVTARLGKIK